jgi:sugar lactone lactonase YvrE
VGGVLYFTIKFLLNPREKKMRRNKPFFICSAFVLITMILWSVNLFSSPTTIYGSRKFTRSTGKPVIVTEAFSAPSTTAHYRLIVLNGENGKNRVSSATIKINGIEILRESDFNQQIDRIERSVSLLLSNSISVQLKSAPGSFITIAIECLDCLVITNHPPVAQEQTVTADEDMAKAITLVATDPDGDPLTYQIVTQPVHGALSGMPPSVTYTPTTRFYGSDNFTFKANDGKADSTIATVSITITHVNHPPVAQDQSVTIDEDVAKAITLFATDPDGDLLTYQIVAQPGHGTLSGTPPSVTYTPTVHYYGSDSFTFKANDGKIDSNVAAVLITVRVNHPPVAQNQCVTTDQDTAKAIILSATDADGDPLAYTIVTQPGHGTLSGTPPIVSYTPAAHYFGRDSFTFKANDGKAGSNVATVSISVAPVIGINVIITVAGNGEISYGGDGGLATKARLLYPSGVTVDAEGNLFIADWGNNRIRKVDKNGISITAAGIGGFWGGYSGDGGPAVQAELDRPEGVALDTLGNLYIAEYENNSIRKVDPNGIITTVAGGVWGFGGDGGPATGARLNGPSGVAVDTFGNLYIADQWNQRIRKVDKDGIITTAAGNGREGYSGDGGPATQAQLHHPLGVAVDTLGNLYIAEEGGHRVRKVGANGIITTFAGNGIEGYSGDGGPATQARLRHPADVAVDPLGNVYIVDTGNGRIRKVDLNGIITTVAGNGISGYSGDGAPATQAQLRSPSRVAVDTLGNLYIADLGNDMIRKVDTNGIITTVAGSREYGDGGPATEANLFMPTGAAMDACGNLYIADNYRHRVRKVDADGIITTVAGNGIDGYSGDGGLATEAQLYYPSGIAVDTLGNLYIADSSNYRVRKVDANGIISTFAGNGDWGYSGDGGPAAQAQLDHPLDVAVDALGNVYIADAGNNRIRKVDTNGIISTFAGSGIAGYSGAGNFGGDGGPATQALMSWPAGVALDSSGNVYIADHNNSRIRKVDTNGVIATVAGSGDEGYGGDGGPATEAQLQVPLDVAIDTSGNLYIADYYNDRIRKVNTNGIITTVAGGGTPPDPGLEFWGDGGPATQAVLRLAQGIAVDTSGNLYIADTDNNRIRKVVGLSKGATIIGKITDSSTHMPLSEITVIIKDSLNTFQTKTDLKGTYAVSGLFPGSFIAIFGMPGFIEQTVNGTSVSGQSKTLDIQLAPAPPPLILTITSPPNGAIFSSSPIWVIGIVSNNANVTVNSIQASVSNNTFSASIPLSEGPNSIFVVATDQYGQTASQSISVTLDTGAAGGMITGTVTDSSTGLPLPSAAVSVTDSSISPQSEVRVFAFIIIAKTALTDSNGRYTIYNISPGAFSGSIRKEGYATYNFSGTMASEQTVTINAALNPILPVIRNIAVSGITANSAVITWATDQLSDSFVEYGTTTSYGSSARDSTLTTNHTISLSNLIPDMTYHFKVTSTNGYGFSSSSGDLTFKTSSPLLISLAITFPTDGSTMTIRDTIVKGTVIHSRGSETGVVVNGILSNIYGIEFVVNHVPLVEGSNSITATATDIDGNTETVSITVNGVTAGNYIRITSNTESGLSPLEAILTLESSLDLTSASLTYAGPAEVEFLSTSVSEYTVRMTNQGIYYFTAKVMDSTGNLYSDTVAITVLPEAYLDGLLRGKWEAMKQAMINRDVEKAGSYFADWTRERYTGIFLALGDRLPQIAQDMQNIRMIYLIDGVAKYRIRRMEEAGEITYYIYFVQDENGLWKIQQF